MSMEFKIGDNVKVVNTESSSDDFILGKCGKIADIDEGWMYPYEVEFFDGSSLPPSYPNLFNEAQLELLESCEDKLVHEEDLSDTEPNLDVRIYKHIYDSATRIVTLEYNDEVILQGDEESGINYLINGFFKGLEHANIKYIEEKYIKLK